MKHFLSYISLITVTMLPQVVAASSDPMCAPLRAFIASIKPDENRAFTFHTSWGGNFKDSSEEVIFAKRCNHDGDPAAKLVCTYLMENGAVEFSGDNVMIAVACLSPGTRFSSGLELHSVRLSVQYGTDNRGSHVKIEYGEDHQLGGMAFHLSAAGY